MPSSQIGFVGLGIPSGTTDISIKDIDANYTLLEGDLLGGVYIRMNLTGAHTVTVPAGLVNAQPVHITQTGAGQTLIVPAVGVTIQSTDDWRRTRTRYSNMTLIPTSSNVYDLIGDLAV